MARKKRVKKEDRSDDFLLLQLPELEKDAEQENKKAIREIISWVALFVAAIAAAGLLVRYVAEAVRVEGTSMVSTLHNNEFVLVNKRAYLNADPQRLDVVICRYPGREETYVKRIVGVPGDTVEVREQTVYVNGGILNEPYIECPPDYEYPPTTMGEDQYFVLGDNRVHSTDSHIIGPISRDAILGRVLNVLYPFQQARPVSSTE